MGKGAEEEILKDGEIYLTARMGPADSTLGHIQDQMTIVAAEPGPTPLPRPGVYSGGQWWVSVDSWAVICAVSPRCKQQRRAALTRT